MKTWRDEVTGLSRKEISARFKGAPWPMTERFCKDWLWWWRELPALAAVDWDPSKLPPKKLHWLRYCWSTRLLGLLAVQGGIEEWLRLSEKAEFRARLRACTGSFGPAPIPFHGDGSDRVKKIKVFKLDDVECDSTEGWNDVFDRVREYLTEKGFVPHEHSVYRQSPRNSKAIGRKGGSWLEIFSAIEAVDRATLLGETLSETERRTINKRLKKRDR